MTLVAKHPDTVRSVVFDSVYPPDPMPPRSSIVAGAREALFDACARDTACAASFPDLARTFRETLDRLGHAPLTVAVPPSMQQAGNRVLLTASAFQLVVGQLVYYPPFYPGLPRLIAAVHDGDTQGLGVVLASLLAAAGRQDLADNAAVECRDRPSFHAPARGGATSLEGVQFAEVCELWAKLGPPPVIPVGTTVPTLVLAGQIDPVAGPALSRRVADAISPHARFVEFPRLGHSVRAFSPCGAAIVAQFIAHPADALDTSCTGRRPPIPFLPRAAMP